MTERPDAKVLTLLGDALFRRKQVTVSYHSMAAGAETERTLEPYGLFFLHGHWYLAARDSAKDGVRNFRVSRMRNAKVNAARAGTADYEIPKTFVLKEHARSRQAWEIGDSERVEAVVEFRGDTGAVRAASALGRAVDGEGRRRRFEVRRVDSFARWLLAFGGDAIPMSPDALVSEYGALVAATRARYA